MADVSRAPVLSGPEVQALIDDTIPSNGPKFVVESVGENRAQVRLVYVDGHLRPGGTVSGPTLMALADCAMWCAVLAMIGPELLSVTVNLNIDFLRKPPPADLVADAVILKLGRRLATGTVTMHSAALDGPVAQASVTYAIPT